MVVILYIVTKVYWYNPPCYVYNVFTRLNSIEVNLKNKTQASLYSDISAMLCLFTG